MNRNTAFSVFSKLALFVSLALIFCFAFAASAESSGTCGDNLTYTLDDDGLLTISGTGEMYDYGDTALWGSGVSSVNIQQGVTSIGK